MADHRYRTIAARIVAGLIDAIVVLPFIGVMYLVDMPDISLWLVGMAMHVVNTAYFVILHGRNGQTLGKRVMNVRVVNANNETRISYRQSIWRESPLIAINLVFFTIEALLFLSKQDEPSAAIVAVYASIQPLPTWWFICDAVAALSNTKRRSIHDLIGGTVVVRER